MRSVQTALLRLLIAGPFLLASILSVHATPANALQEEEFGPVVRAYLGYLRNEQEVVDDRASRREVSAAYYRHNSNRIRALRQIAIRIARETQNDYLPELEAVSRAGGCRTNLNNQRQKRNVTRRSAVLSRDRLK